jgi:hypothetical protein
MPDTFPVIILIGRPAAGKSEIIDYLKRMPDGARCAKLHIAPFVEVDDFVWVWQIFGSVPVTGESLIHSC